MRLALTGGGTGGHIFPALAVLEAVRAASSAPVEVCFFGPENRGERPLVESAGVPFEGVPSAGLRGRGPIGLARSAWSLLSGVVIAIRKLRRFRPDVVFSTGGYGSFPGSLAARLLRRPLVVYLPDVHPGWAVKAERVLATRMTTTTDAALEFLPAKKTVVTGYPVRHTFFTLTRDEARAQLGIAPDERVVVIAGASQGARAINNAVFHGLLTLCRTATVVHVTGEPGLAAAIDVREALPPDLRDRYQPSPFRSDLPALMLAADVGVFRAGASVLGEIPAAALPSILIPGTFAGGHQRNNARWLADNGAAVILEEEGIEAFGARVSELLENDARREAMRVAARGLARPDAAAAIATVVMEVARK
ncbi:MAG: UDP-N-acetylglucosamine--N-acetylmuramyl-(pentapeptide) pyrophosphoryl-undecaprenol N-acetylglucosamine transferase [Dehalococcoidia bacterium]|nr:UDP-N-acetylglucosamine--N-acetylmuramyl-(pentapeptide) pyrophosphoryl-undecaprenol N-acetylglucosamine transferase [Dehalococcoidia bacterium]